MREIMNRLDEAAASPKMLYHATAVSRLPSILQHGLSGEFTKVNPGFVHFTPFIDQAEGYLGHWNEGDCVILAVPLARLDQSKLGPDREDLSDMIPAGRDWHEYSWKQSVRICGQCTYEGVVPPDEIFVEEETGELIPLKEWLET